TGGRCVRLLADRLGFHVVAGAFTRTVRRARHGVVVSRGVVLLALVLATHDESHEEEGAAYASHGARNMAQLRSSCKAMPPDHIARAVGLGVVGYDEVCRVTPSRANHPCPAPTIPRTPTPARLRARRRPAALPLPRQARGSAVFRSSACSWSPRSCSGSPSYSSS